MSEFETRIIQVLASAKRAVSLELNYRVRPPEPENSIPAAVMVLLGLSDQAGSGEDPAVLITRRTDRVQTHKGQYAFPGGMVDPEDHEQGQGLTTTALRELEEEMGISGALVQPVGELPKIWTPSGFIITPIVGVLQAPLERIEIHPSEGEIDHYFWAKVSDLTAPGVHATEMHRYGNVDVPIEVFQLGEHRIWGATGAMLKNFLDRLRELS